MLGAIIGDIVGSRWEFNPTNDYDFEWLSSDVRMRFQYNATKLTLFHDTTKFSLSISRNLK